MTGLWLTCRYGMVSAVCLLLHNIIMIAADGLHQNLLIALGESFCVVVVTGYLLHSRFTFEMSPSWSAFSRYGVAMAMNLPASFVILSLFVTLLGWRMAIAAPMATGVTILLNFAASRWAIYRGVRIGKERRAC